MARCRGPSPWAAVVIGVRTAQPGFDDSSWTLADHPVSTYGSTAAATPVLCISLEMQVRLGFQGTSATPAQ
jgi:hypothetical protein